MHSFIIHLKSSSCVQLIRSKEHIASLKGRISKLQIIAAVNKASPEEEDAKHLEALLIESKKVNPSKTFSTNAIWGMR